MHFVLQTRAYADGSILSPGVSELHTTPCLETLPLYPIQSESQKETAHAAMEAALTKRLFSEVWSRFRGTSKEHCRTLEVGSSWPAAVHPWAKGRDRETTQRGSPARAQSWHGGREGGRDGHPPLLLPTRLLLAWHWLSPASSQWTRSPAGRPAVLARWPPQHRAREKRD